MADAKLNPWDCDYTNSDDILIDLIVSGVRHQKVQERLLDLGQDLTLEKAIDKGRQYEFSQSHMTVIRCRALGNAELRVLVRTFFPLDA